MSEVCPTCGRKWNKGKPGQSKLARALFAKRQADHLTLREAADKAGISHTTFFRAERDRAIDLGHAVTLADWLGMTLDELFR